MPTYDLAGSSKDSIPETSAKSNPSDENSLGKSKDSPDIRYSLPDGMNLDESVDTYTEEQYNSFGWARYSEALTKNELDDLYSKLQEKKNLRRFKQSAQGEAIIEVNNKPHTTLGVDNVFVFVKGKATEPEITRVMRVSLFSETDMQKVRKYIYAREKSSPDGRESIIVRNIFDSGLFAEYRREDFGSYQEYLSEIRKRSSGSKSKGNPLVNRVGNERERDLRGSKDDVSHSLPSDFDPNAPLLDENGKPIAFENVVENGRTGTSGDVHYLSQ